MIRDSTNDEVMARARQIDAGRQAGLTNEQLIDLVGARATWHSHGHVPPRMLTEPLLVAAKSDAAMTWDAVFTTALRRQLRKLSDPSPNVTP